MDETKYTPGKREVFQAVILLVVSIGVLLLLRSAYQILLLAFLGIVFGVFLRGLAQQVHGISRMPLGWSLATILLLGLLAFAALLAWSIPTIAADGAQLASKLPEALDQLEDRMRDSDWGRAVIRELARLPDDFGRSADNVSRFLGVFSTLIGGFVGGLIVVILGIYIAAEPGVYVGGLLKLVSPEKRERGAEVLQQIAHALHWWLLGRLASMTVVFVLTWAGLMLLDMPLALVLAVIAGLLSAIPNIGPVLSAIPALLLALGEAPQTALYVLLLYLGIQIMESYTITPLIQRRAVSLPPGLLLGAQLLIGTLAGFIGLFAAPPLLVACTVLVKMLYIEDQHHEKADTM